MAFTGYYCCPQCKPSVVAKIARGEPVGTLWRHGNKLVALVNTPLLDRCVKCNGNAKGYRLKRQLFWHHPALYVLVISPLIYIIVAAIVQKRSKTQVGLCPEHRGKRLKGILIGWALFLTGAAGLIASIANLTGPTTGAGVAGTAIIASIVVILGGIITIAVVSRTVTPTRITRRHVFLKGIHPDYLDSLPVWSEAGPGA
jgi:hypothetical protein